MQITMKKMWLFLFVGLIFTPLLLTANDNIETKAENLLDQYYSESLNMQSERPTISPEEAWDEWYRNNNLRAPLQVNIMPSNDNNSMEGNAIINEDLWLFGSAKFGNDAGNYDWEISVNDEVLYSGSNLNGRFLGHLHAFTTSGKKTVKITVTKGSETVSKTATVRVWQNPIKEIKVAFAIQEGLAYLYQNALPADATSVDGVYWTSPSNYSGYGHSAFAILSFEENGHLASNSFEDDIYAETVSKGIYHLLHLSSSVSGTITLGAGQVQTDGDPDYCNDNNVGAYFLNNHGTYAGAAMLMALMGGFSNVTDLENYIISGGVFNGWSAKRLVEDHLDTFSYCQGDPDTRKGGWVYNIVTPDDGRYDGSAQQWVILAFKMAEDKFGITAPQWVKENALTAYENIQDPNGGIGYSGPSGGRVSMTSGILAASSWNGIDSSTEITNAKTFFDNNWDLNNVYSGWYGNLYAMYSCKKGLDLIGIENIDSYSWYDDFAGWLLGDNTIHRASINSTSTYDNSSYAYGWLSHGCWRDGYWIGTNYSGATALSILTLTQAVTVLPPVAVAQNIGDQPVNTPFQVDGSASFHLDLTKSIISWEWDFDNDDVFDDAVGQRPTCEGFSTVNPVGSPYILKLRVTDNTGGTPQTDVATFTVNVTAGNHPPVAVAIPESHLPSYAGKPNTNITLDASDSYDPDSGDTIDSYEWDINGDGTYTETGITVDVDFASGYTGQIGLRVTDNHGAVSSNTAYVDIATAQTDTYVGTFTSSRILPGDTEVAINCKFHNDTSSDINVSNALVQFFDGNPFTSGNRFGSDYTVDLPIGDVDSLVFSLPFPAGLDTIWVFLDANQVVNEFNEANNIGFVEVLYGFGTPDNMVVDEDGVVVDNVIDNDIESSHIDLVAITDAAAHGLAEIVSADSGTVRYTPDPDFNGTDEFRYSYSYDDVEDEVNHVLVSVTVNPINDAPILYTAALPADRPFLNDIQEDDTDNMGTSAQGIIASGVSHTNNIIDDVDAGAVEGIAVTGVNNDHGYWEFSTDNGENWNILNPSPEAARLLASAPENRIRFVPDLNWYGESNITFRAWDRTTGTNGLTANVTIGDPGRNISRTRNSRNTRGGGTTAFSTATETASLRVISYDDAPVLHLTVTSDDYYEDDRDFYLDNALTITDVDTPTNIDGATVTIYGNNISGEDRFEWVDMYGITGSANNDTGVLTFTGNGTPSQYEDVLREVEYYNNSQNPTENTRSFSISLGRRLYNPDNGHFYGLETVEGYSWVASRTEAETIALFGLTGYLTTITSETEASFIADKINTNTWIGASDFDNESIWRWVTGPEGLEEGGLGRHFLTQTSANSSSPNLAGVYGNVQPGGGIPENGYYNNWDSDEPNDWSNESFPEGEDFAHFWSHGTWNDYNIAQQLNAYVVEFVGYDHEPTLQIAGVIDVTVHRVNDAPEIHTGGNPHLEPVLEDILEPAGTTIASIISSSSNTLITDVDLGSVEGLAITAVDDTYGTWQYTTNDGGAWTNFGTPSNSEARLLSSHPDNKIRFVPDAEIYGTSSITIHAWDRTTGTNGQTGDIGPLRSSTRNSKNYRAGGTSAYSTDPETVTITINADNDQPKCDIVPGITGSPYVGQEFSSSTGTWNDTLDVNYDIDAVGYTFNPTYLYQWQYSVDGGANYSPVTGETSSTFTVPDNYYTRYIRCEVTCRDNGYGANTPQDSTVYTNEVEILNTAPVFIHGETEYADGDTLRLDTNEDTPLIFELVGYDGDDSQPQTWDTLSVNNGVVVIANSPARLRSSRSTIESKMITYTPNANEYGLGSFYLSLSDGIGSRVISYLKVEVTINPVNDTPTNIDLPYHTGYPYVNQTHHVTTGVWSDSLDVNGDFDGAGYSFNPSYAYQWQYSTNGGASYLNVTDETDSTFVIPEHYMTYFVRCRVTCTDDGYGLNTPQSLVRYSNEIEILMSPPVFIYNEIRYEDGDTLALSVDEDDVLTFDLIANVDNPGCTFNWDYTDGEDGILNISPLAGRAPSQDPRTLTYTPNPEVYGEDHITVRIEDIWEEAEHRSRLITELNIIVTINPLNDAPVNEILPVAEGRVFVNETLTLTNHGTWNDTLDVIGDVDGAGYVPNLTYDYQWQVSENNSIYYNIPGETATTFVVPDTYALQFVRCMVRCTDDGYGIPESRSTKRPTNVFYIQDSDPIIFYTDTPLVNGEIVDIEVNEDSLITLELGVEDDNANQTFSWRTLGVQNGAVNILESELTREASTDEKIISYTPDADYYGEDEFRIIVEDNLGNESYVIFNVTVIPVNDAPYNTALPIITGNPFVTQTLSTNEGLWSDSIDEPNPGNITVTYQWQYSVDDISFENITGEILEDYVVENDKLGNFIRCQVTGTDDGYGLPEHLSASVYTASVKILNSQAFFEYEETPYLDGETLELTVLEDNDLLFDLTVADIDPGQIFEWELSNAENGTVDFTLTDSRNNSEDTKALIFTPNDNYFGGASFDVNVTESMSETITLHIDIDVIPVNDAPYNVEQPVISGDAVVMGVLTVDKGDWSDSFDDPKAGNLTYSYKWQYSENGEDFEDIIRKRVSNDLYIPDNFAGKYVRCLVTATDDGYGSPEHLSASAPSNVIQIQNTDPVFVYDDQPYESGSEIDLETNEEETLRFNVSVEDMNSNESFNWNVENAINGATSFNLARVSTETIEVIYTPAIDYYGPDVVNISVEDSFGSAIELIFNIEVLPINDIPVNDENPVISGEPYIRSILSTDNGLWNDNKDAWTEVVFSYEYQWQVSSERSGFVDIVDQTNNYLLVPDNYFGKIVRCQITAIDNGYGLPEHQQAIAYSNEIEILNSPVTIGDEEDNVYENNNVITITTYEDTPISFILDAIDPNIGQSFTWNNTDATDGSVVANIPNPDQIELTYTPDSNYNGNDVFTVSVDDNAGSTCNVTVEVIVLPVNDPPVLAFIPEIIIPEDGTITIDITGFDEETPLSELIFSAVSSIDELVVTVDNINDQLTITPAPDWNGTAYITVEISDGELTDTQIVNVIVNDEYDALSFELPESFTFPEDNILEGIDFMDYIEDIDSNTPYTIEVVSGNSNVQIETNGTIVDFSSAKDWCGTETITFSVTDALGHVTYSQVDVIVTPVNDQPQVINPINYIEFDEDSVYEITDLTQIFGDVDVIYGDILTYSAISSEHLNVDINGVAVTITPEVNWNGIEQIRLKVTDAIGASNFVDINVRVLPVNDPPTIDIPASYSLLQGGSKRTDFTPYVFDVDGDELFLSVEGNENIEVNFYGMTVEFISNNPEYFGSENLTFTVTDNHPNSFDTDVAEVIVNFVNHAPFYVGPSNISIDEDSGEYVIGAVQDLFDDIDEFDENLNISLINYDGSKIDVEVIDGMLVITTLPDVFGYTEIILKAVDNGAMGTTPLSVQQALPINIVPVNDPPVIITLPELITITPGTEFPLYLDMGINFMDPDDTNLTVEIISPEGLVEVSEADYGNFNWLLNAITPDQIGEITIVVKDPYGAEATATIPVEILGGNPPQITSFIPNQEYDEDFPLTFACNLFNCFEDNEFADSDLEFEFIQLSPVAPEGLIEFYVNPFGELYLGAGLENWSGVVEVQVNCSKPGSNNTATQTFTITVNPVNDEPVVDIEPETVSIYEDTNLEDFNVQEVFDDVDLPFGDILSYNIMPGQHLSCIIEDGLLTVTPDPDWYGEETVIIEAEDSEGETATFELLVIVESVYDAPMFNLDIMPQEILVDYIGEIIDFSRWINTFGQDNVDPILVSLIGNQNFYDINLEGVESEDVYSVNIIPVGFQWGFPDQSCMLRLRDNNGQICDSIVVELVTNMSPYMPNLVDDIFTTVNDFNVADLNLPELIEDPENHEIIFEIYFNRSEIIAELDENNIVSFTQVPGFIGTTNLTVHATDVHNRATRSFYFHIHVTETLARVLSDNLVIESGIPTRIPLKSILGISENRDVDVTLKTESSIMSIEENDLTFFSNTEKSDKISVEFYLRDNTSGVKFTKEINVVIIPASISRDTKQVDKFTTGIISNYPNPFSLNNSNRAAGMTISYSLAKAGDVEISVYDILGKRVKTLEKGYKTEGLYNANWDAKSDSGKEVGSGMYFIKLNTAGTQKTRKMILVK